MRKLTLENFINKATLIHGNKYDYSLVDYTNSQTKIKIICSVHGIFTQRPNNHLQGVCCQKCTLSKTQTDNKYTLTEFIIKSKIFHGDKYDYGLVEYINSKTKVKIICPEHGEFLQTPESHFDRGCIKCGYISSSNKQKSNTNCFILKAKGIHGDKYDYSLVNYINNHTKVNIMCYKHGIFEQAPEKHLGNKGCPSCNESKGEKIINDFLTEQKIIFIREKIFPGCKYKQLLEFDFYLPEQNMCIEFNGIQHYEFNKFFHRNEEEFIGQQKRDAIKLNYCFNNKITLIIIKYDENITETLIHLSKLFSIFSNKIAIANSPMVNNILENKNPIPIKTPIDAINHISALDVIPIILS